MRDNVRFIIYSFYFNTSIRKYQSAKVCFIINGQFLRVNNQFLMTLEFNFGAKLTILL